MSLVLVSAAGDRRFPIDDTIVMTVGREVTCDIPILDHIVSRRHAELYSVPDGVSVEDKGSRNGTWINGRRVRRGFAGPGDTLAFGSIAFQVLVAGVAPPGPPSPRPTPLDNATSVRHEQAVPSPEQAVAAIAGDRLAKLVTIAQRLGGLESVEALLHVIVSDLLATFDVDRVAVMLPDTTGTLVTRLARDQRGDEDFRPVPRAIADGVAHRQVALLTHDATSDLRTIGASVVRQSVRSAMAAPMLGEGRVTLGLVYVDNLRDAHAFSEDDLGFLVAIAGIAAAAVEREAASARLRTAARVRENFERYFTPRLAERIAAEPGAVSPGGERRHVVVLFSDIRGFTAIAESLPAMMMAAQLNEYFGVMVDCVFRHHGALDKFIGDALMAYWGAPESAVGDSDRALTAARDMQSELAHLNARWAAEGRPTLDVGIGIHCGDAFVGNIGSPRRLEYTLIGDTVNLASRLCALAQGGDILMTRAVRESLLHAPALRERPELIPVRHSGIHEPVWSLEQRT